MSDFKEAITHAAAGLRAQSARMRIVAQNVANADSVSLEPGGEPYRRKTIFFKNEFDRHLGQEIVKVDRIDTDPRPFPLGYDPSHPAANAAGYYQKPNVTTLIESQDLKEAQRSYEANLATIEITKSLVQQTLDILR